MNRNIIIVLFTVISIVFSVNIWSTNPPQKDKNKSKSKEKSVTPKETKEAPLVKIDTVKTKPVAEVLEVVDSIKTEPNLKFKFYKKTPMHRIMPKSFMEKELLVVCDLTITNIMLLIRNYPLAPK